MRHAINGRLETTPERIGHYNPRLYNTTILYYDIVLAKSDEYLKGQVRVDICMYIIHHTHHEVSH